MNHRIQCQCGALTGEVSNTHAAMRAVCYCKDCRAFAVHLGQAQTVLDALGGTEIVATQPRYVSFTSGAQNLACLSLSPRGLLRWYAKCCNTPIANISRNWQLPFVGLVHACLQKPLESSFPPVQMHAYTANAKGKPASVGARPIAALLAFMSKLLLARLSGAYKQTPFFSAAGTPVAEVKVLSKSEREQASSAI